MWREMFLGQEEQQGTVCPRSLVQFSTVIKLRFWTRLLGHVVGTTLGSCRGKGLQSIDPPLVSYGGL